MLQQLPQAPQAQGWCNAVGWRSVSLAGYVRVRVQAGRQINEPWDVPVPEQQMTAWQQRQQQQLNRQRPRAKTKPKTQQGWAATQQAAATGRRHNARQEASHLFMGCDTYQMLHARVQQLRGQGQHQQQGAGQSFAAESHLGTQSMATADMPASLAEEQQQQQQQHPSHPMGQQQQQAAAQNAIAVQQQLLQLTAQQYLDLLHQLATIGRTQHSSTGGNSSSSSYPFAEDQALQHILALVYASIDQNLQQQQQRQQWQATQLGGSFSPQQLLKGIRALAGLKYTQPVQLASWLEAAAPAAQPAAGSTQPHTAAGNAAAAAAGGFDGAGGAAAAAGISGYRQVLSTLRMHELAAMIASLARAGVRPSNVWLLAFMQVAQQKLSSADLLQLAQLLSGLVKVGVKPTPLWLDTMEARALQRLLEQAVQQQVAADQQRQQQQQQDVAASALPARNSSSSSSSWKPSRQGQKTYRSRGGVSTACPLHHVAQLLSALAEARHTPKPQLAAVLWGATGSSLRTADGPSLVELLVALGELQLVPPAAWLEQFFAASSSSTVLQHYKPWQLSGSAAALGRLAAASAAQQQQSQQGGQRLADVPGCKAWVVATLATVQQHLPAFAARDLAALLSGLAALQPAVEAQQLQELLTELQSKLPRLNTAGLAATTEAAVVFHKQWRQQQQQQLSGGFLEALLREVAVKLPMFPADDLARVVLAVAASGTRPSGLWAEAVAAQLSSKLTLLAPSTLLAVVSAFIRLGSPPDQHWLERAVAALDGRLMELSGPQLQQLLSLLLSVGITPTAVWLDAADWAAKQVGQQQQQQQQPASSSPQQSAGSDGLEAAGAGLYAQQQESCEQLIARLREGTVQTSVVCDGLE